MSFLLSSNAMKLDQSDGKGTNSFLICRLTGRWSFLRLVFFPSLMDSLRYNQMLYQSSWRCRPSCTQCWQMFLHSRQQFWYLGVVARAITSACPSINRQPAPSRETVVGVLTSCVYTLANKKVFAECRMPLVVASDSRADINSCCRFLLRLTSCPAL